MKSLFSRLSVKNKLLVISITSSVFSLLLALLILLVIQVNDVKRKSQEDFLAVATLIANRTVAAVVFDDNTLAQENLNSLTNLAELLNACIYDKKGVLFAALNKSSLLCPGSDVGLQSQYEQLVLNVFEPMRMDEDIIGSVLIRADLTSALKRQFQFISVVVTILFIALLLAFILTIPLLNRVTKPIALLARTAHNISHHHDYSLRVAQHCDDEIGILIVAFNTMLDTIEQKNQALMTAKNNYQALYDNNPTMVFDLEERGIIKAINQMGANQLGWSDERLLGRSLFEFVHPDDLFDVQAFIEQCQLYPRQIHKQECRFICCNDNIIWVRNTARLVDDGSQAKRLLLVCEDITETRHLVEKIAYQASHDELTGLVNRRQFDIHIQRLVEQTQHDQSEHVLCYLDLDQFKVINDTCGHLAGDELLRQLGELLKQQVRKSDILARLGGDEFGILMMNCALEQALITGDKLRDVIRDFQFAWENRIFSIGVSIGLAPIHHVSGNAVEVLKEADAACYAAKEKGRNRVHVFKPDDGELAERQGEMQWVEKIHLGIERNQFQLYAQLIVPIDKTDQGLHFETLIRYQNASGTLIPPGAFLPAAERYNIAAELDRWVISRLFEHIAITPGFADRLEVCSVNLSGLSLSDETMLDFIDVQFQRWQIPRAKICFEITETAAIGNLSYAQRFINTLRGQGCSFSLDDFGSGLSSFAYLKNLPVDYLKIDGLFVKDILDDPIDWSMVKAINEVGHVMHKKTIAEFVENQAIFDLLHELGVDYAQGYGIARPVPLKNL